MLPVIALVGRPNVGKSTLFNRLTRSRDALVADEPGLTRDRQYGIGRIGDRPYVVVDTGGLIEAPTTHVTVDAMVSRQALLAAEEADAILFLVDARSGLTPLDLQVADTLRRLDKPVLVLVNKADRAEAALAEAEFHQIGIGQPHAISAAHGRGVAQVMDEILERVPGPGPQEAEAQGVETEAATRIAVVGRPNVGKSTLINRILGEQRVLVSEEPGTTRDSIAVPFARDGRHYVLVDTAGVRRRARVQDKVEKFSVVKTLQAIEAADVALLVVDAQQGIGEQDARLLGYVLECGRAVVLVVNKWDGLSAQQRTAVRRDLDRKLPFASFAAHRFISALHGTGVGDLFPEIDEAHASATRHLSTPELTRILQEAVVSHPPPAVRGRRIKLRYAHQGGERPPLVVIHGNQTEHLTEAYKRYLVNAFRDALRLPGTPLLIELRTGENPYQGRRNVLTPRQMRKRRRLLRHAKGRG